MNKGSIDFLKECILSTAPTSEYGIFGDTLERFVPYIRMVPEHYTSSPSEVKLYNYLKNQICEGGDELSDVMVFPEYLFRVVRGEFNLGRDCDSEIDECRDEILFILCNLMKLQQRIDMVKNILYEFKNEDKVLLRDELRNISGQLKNLQKKD